MEKYVKGIAVHEYGDRNKVPIIFIHGFPFNSTMWAQQIKILKEQYYCVAYDVRGMGETPPGDGQFTIEMFVDDLFAVSDGLDLERPIVAGFSMGGYIALRAVEREPERFRALILADTKAEADDDAGRLKRANAISSINKDGVEQFVSDFVPLAFSETARQNIPETYNLFLERAQTESPIGVKGCLLAMAARTDTTNSLADIRIPTLLLVGEHDTLTPPEVMRQMQDRIGGSVIVHVPKAGHMAPVENPEFVTQG
ncbi:MAG: alpha/beta hydrolase, partial [Gammaproteobacteria bacterium]